MNKKTTIKALWAAVAALVLTGCFGGKSAMSSGGEVTGAGGRAFSEPTPYGMVMIPRGHLRMGTDKQDSLWGRETPLRDISVEGFWMDEKEITNSQYRQFVLYVRDSIIRERLADPAYGGDETYKIEEDENGDPVKPYLNWKKAIPRKPNEDELRAIESVYTTNPVTGEKMLDARQMNYRYEVYDYTAAAFARIPAGPFILGISVIAFAIATLIGWSYFGDCAVNYLFGSRCVKTFRFWYLFMIFLGAIMPLTLVWEATDFINALMTLPNLLALWLLRKKIPRDPL